MRKRLTLLCVALLWLSHAGLITAEQLDQQQLISSGTLALFNDLTWAGQTFVPAISGALSGFQVSLSCSGCANATADDKPAILIDVRTTSGGVPTETVLAATTVPGFSSGSKPFYPATFIDPASLSAGTTYAVTIHSAGPRATGSYAATISVNAAAYPDGNGVTRARTGLAWTIIRSGAGATARDLTFKTFMKETQLIDFAALADRVIGEPDFPIEATASSGLPVSLSASGACTVSGTTAHITSLGSCAITATQKGDDTYARAHPVTQSFAITYAPAGECLGSPGHQVLPPVPVDGSGVWRKNATIPVKFRVCDFNGVSIGTPDVVTSFALLQVVKGTVTTDVNQAPGSTTPYTAFRWDPLDQQWIFNLSTKDLAAGATYRFRIGLDDASSIEFSFGLR